MAYRSSKHGVHPPFLPKLRVSCRLSRGQVDCALQYQSAASRLVLEVARSTAPRSGVHGQAAPPAPGPTPRVGRSSDAMIGASGQAWRVPGVRAAIALELGLWLAWTPGICGQATASTLWKQAGTAAWRTSTRDGLATSWASALFAVCALCRVAPFFKPQHAPASTCGLARPVHAFARGRGGGRRAKRARQLGCVRAPDVCS
jgi:hypothetical protein